MGDVWSWVLFLIILIALIVMLVCQLISLADLEFDYVNVYDCTSRINMVVLPEFITQGVLCLFFLVTGHWIMTLLCIPYLYYNVIWTKKVCTEFEETNSDIQLLLVGRYIRRQHLVDVTEIYNTLGSAKKQRLVKLGYIILLLFTSLFWMIYNALEDDE